MIVAAGLLLAFFLVLVFSNRSMSQCRWRLDRGRSTARGDFYRCAACGAETTAPPGRRPSRCAAQKGSTP